MEMWEAREVTDDWQEDYTMQTTGGLIAETQAQAAFKSLARICPSIHKHFTSILSPFFFLSKKNIKNHLFSIQLNENATKIDFYLAKWMLEKMYIYIPKGKSA